MGKIGLQLKATLNNIDKLYPYQSEKFCWPLKVKCTSCQEENPNWHLVSQDEKIELTHSEVNFLYKCKCCGKENNLAILPSNQVNARVKTARNGALVNSEYTKDDDGEFRTLIAFECRGLDLIAFEARDGWAVESGKKIFTDVDLTEKEWVEYNDIDNLPVEISNIEYQFIAIK